MEDFNENAEHSQPKHTDIYVDAGRLVLVATEMMNTYDERDALEMAEQGLIVIPVAYGQNVYQLIKNDEL